MCACVCVKLREREEFIGEWERANLHIVVQMVPAHRQTLPGGVCVHVCVTVRERGVYW